MTESERNLLQNKINKYKKMIANLARPEAYETDYLSALKLLWFNIRAMFKHTSLSFIFFHVLFEKCHHLPSDLTVVQQVINPAKLLCYGLWGLIFLDFNHVRFVIRKSYR